MNNKFKFIFYSLMASSLSIKSVHPAAKTFSDSKYIQRSCTVILASDHVDSLVMPGSIEQQFLSAVETPEDALQFAVDQGLIFTTASLHALARSLTEFAAPEYLENNRFMKVWGQRNRFRHAGYALIMGSDS